MNILDFNFLKFLVSLSFLKKWDLTELYKIFDMQLNSLLWKLRFFKLANYLLFYCGLQRLGIAPPKELL